MRRIILAILFLLISSGIFAQTQRPNPLSLNRKTPLRPVQPVQNAPVNPQNTQALPGRTPVATITPENTPAPGKVLIRFEEGDVKEMIKEFSEILGRNFTYDETLKGRVSLIGPKEVSKWEAKKIFEASLEMIGYSVVWGWPINKIVPVADAKAEGNVPVM